MRSGEQCEASGACSREGGECAAVAVVVVVAVAVGVAVVSDSTRDVDTDLGLDGATRYEASVMPDRPPSVPDIVRQR